MSTRFLWETQSRTLFDAPACDACRDAVHAVSGGVAAEVAGVHRIVLSGAFWKVTANVVVRVGFEIVSRRKARKLNDNGSSLFFLAARMDSQTFEGATSRKRNALRAHCTTGCAHSTGVRAKNSREVF
jgi:hypothetical protein